MFLLHSLINLAKTTSRHFAFNSHDYKHAVPRSKLPKFQNSLFIFDEKNVLKGIFCYLKKQ